MFKAKKYIIIGATSGIGYAISEALLNRGAEVVAIGRNGSELTPLFEEFTSAITFINYDLNNLLNIESDLIPRLPSFTKFDGFVFCAGVENTTPLGLCTPELILNMFNVNILASIESLRHFSKKKLSVDGSSFVFFASVMAELGQAGKVGYCASKAAILGMVRASALELAKRDIRINAISPAIVSTPMSNRLFENLPPESLIEIKKNHPLGFGQVGDIVSATLFLLSPEAKWITGQNMKIDGGYSIK